MSYNINGLEERLHELINILVQYEATIEKPTPSVLVGEASTSKKRRARLPDKKIKKGGMTSTAASTSSAPVTPLGGGKGKRKRVR
ncbi:UNVERIFIED_CONTAM: hypothetical protein Sradi_1303800 [Sesamum radiatum]|uniref:Uncharacterized protein n=1 Tax=Sesamum radiatum TaxID=300843 RepID=A0AAW2UPY8_SESRA